MRFLYVRVGDARIDQDRSAVVAHAQEQFAQLAEERTELFFESGGIDVEGLELIAERDVGGARYQIIPVRGIRERENRQRKPNRSAANSAAANRSPDPFRAAANSLNRRHSSRTQYGRLM